MWDCPEYLWMQMNDEQLETIWRDLSERPPDSILQVVLEAVLQAKPDQATGRVDWEILLDNRSKRRGDNMLNPGRNN